MGDLTPDALGQAHEELYKREEADERGDDTEACDEVVLFGSEATKTCPRQC
jgi:hypothetical protein